MNNLLELFSYDDQYFSKAPVEKNKIYEAALEFYTTISSCLNLQPTLVERTLSEADSCSEDNGYNYLTLTPFISETLSILSYQGKQTDEEYLFIKDTLQLIISSFKLSNFLYYFDVVNFEISINTLIEDLCNIAQLDHMGQVHNYARNSCSDYKHELTVRYYCEKLFNYVKKYNVPLSFFECLHENYSINNYDCQHYESIDDFFDQLFAIEMPDWLKDPKLDDFQSRNDLTADMLQVFQEKIVFERLGAAAHLVIQLAVAKFIVFNKDEAIEIINQYVDLDNKLSGFYVEL